MFFDCLSCSNAMRLPLLESESIKYEAEAAVQEKVTLMNLLVIHDVPRWSRRFAVH